MLLARKEGEKGRRRRELGRSRLYFWNKCRRVGTWQTSLQQGWQCNITGMVKTNFGRKFTARDFCLHFYIHSLPSRPWNPFGNSQKEELIHSHRYCFIVVVSTCNLQVLMPKVFSFDQVNFR